MKYLKARGNRRNAADTAMKAHAFAMLAGIIFLCVHRHAVAIRRHGSGRCDRRNRYRQRGQGHYKQKHRKEEIAEHRQSVSLFIFNRHPELVSG